MGPRRQVPEPEPILEVHSCNTDAPAAGTWAVILFLLNSVCKESGLSYVHIYDPDAFTIHLLVIILGQAAVVRTSRLLILTG